MTDKDFIPGEKFHKEVKKVYSGKLGKAVFKKGAKMARVLYTAAHENADFPPKDSRHGWGKDYATWVFSEEPGLEEGIFSTGLELVIDARFEPGAAIGLHVHDRTEEIYYILEGSVTMTTVLADGTEEEAKLSAGDALALRLNEGHYGLVGPDGVRFIAVAVRKLD